MKQLKKDSRTKSFVILSIVLQTVLCKLEVTRTTNQDLYKGLTTCLAFSHDTGDGQCKCNFDEKIFYGNTETLAVGCYKLDQVKSDTGCQSLQTFNDDRRKIILPSTCQINSVYNWNIEVKKSKPNATWQILTEPEVFNSNNKTIEINKERSLLSGLLFKINLNCVEDTKKSDCLLVSFTGNRLYPVKLNEIFKTSTESSTTTTTTTIKTMTTSELSTKRDSRNGTNAKTTIIAEDSEPETWLLIHTSVFGIILILGILGIICVYRSKIGRRLRSNKIRNKQSSYTKPVQPHQQRDDEEHYRELDGEEESEYHNYDAHYKSLTFPHNREPNAYHELNRSLTMPSNNLSRDSSKTGYTNVLFKTDITQPATYSAPNLNELKSPNQSEYEVETERNSYYNAVQPIHNDTEYQLPQIPEQEYREVEHEYKEIEEAPYETIPNTTQNYMVIDE